MILGVDPGYAKCGWSIVEPRTARIIELGVIFTEKVTGLDVSTDRARRVAVVGAELGHVALAHQCTAIAAESPLGYGPAAAVAANMLPWGALIQLAVVRGLELAEVKAKTWQHAVQPGRKKIDYPSLEREMRRHVGPQVGARLMCIPDSQRNHALDACGVGMLFALRPREAKRILTRTEAA